MDGTFGYNGSSCKYLDRLPLKTKQQTSGSYLSFIGREGGVYYAKTVSGKKHVEKANMSRCLSSFFINGSNHATMFLKYLQLLFESSIRNAKIRL